MRRWALLLLILLALLPLKIARRPGSGPYGLDASYYFQIARHVSEGNGLLTSVSLYHEGLHPLPAPATIYPLWPLVLGYSGRWLGLVTAANVLPIVFFFVDLLLLYVLTNRIAERMSGTHSAVLIPRPVPIDAGHVIASLFAVNRIFSAATSHPYTEGPAFALAFASLLSLPSSATRKVLTRALAAGALAGLAFMARSQMLVIVLGTLPALFLLAWRESRQWRLIVAYGGGIAAAIVPWMGYRAATVGLDAASPFGGARTPSPIGGFVTWVPSGSPAEYLADRLPGLFVAFDPWSALSYFSSFGTAAVLVPLALVWLIVDGARRERGALFRCTQDDVLIYATVLTGLASHFILVHRHAQFFLPWLFGWRHGLPFIFLLLTAFIFLATRGSRVVRVGTAAVVVITLITGLFHFVADARAPRPAPSAAEQQFVQWVAALPSTPTLLTTNPQSLAVLTRASYHWTRCAEPPTQTRRMLQKLPIDYVVVYERETRCPFVADVRRDLRMAAVFGPEGARIFVLTPSGREGAGTATRPTAAEGIAGATRRTSARARAQSSSAANRPS